ncbi:hypothetical protein EMPS_09805 [Entomortierella parvispora]|uniref:Uncharacterized protein n=1 Tax=Entomortierella parvispora TaxID=205924 RepID=A0A9P3HIW6_9FUNG|nr:hypothetical protein EMPS_09805 [Entomortierella parvispora]
MPSPAYETTEASRYWRRLAYNWPRLVVALVSLYGAYYALNIIQSTSQEIKSLSLSAPSNPITALPILSGNAIPASEPPQLTFSAENSFGQLTLPHSRLKSDNNAKDSKDNNNNVRDPQKNVTKEKNNNKLLLRKIPRATLPLFGQIRLVRNPEVDRDGQAEAAAIYTLLVISSLSIIDNGVGLMVATRRSLRLTQVAFAIWCLRFIFRILSLVSVLFMLVLSTEVRKRLPLDVEVGSNGGSAAELGDTAKGHSMVAVTVLELVVALVHGWSLLVLIRDLRNQPRPSTVVSRAWKWFRETRWGGRGRWRAGTNPYQGLSSCDNNSSNGSNTSLPALTSQNPSFSSLSSLGMFYRESTLDEDLENVWASRASRANPETMSIRSMHSINTLGSIILGRASPEMVSATSPGRSRASSICSSEKSEKLNELLVCLCVCSTWNSALNPLLWSKVPLPQRWKISKDPSLCPSTETLHRNANHIFELTCLDLYLVDQLIPGCCRLEKLVMRCLGPQVCQLLLQSQKTLKEVYLRRDSLQDNGEDFTDEIIQALQKCENLERLVLNDFLIKPRDDRDGAESNVAQDFYKFLKRVPHLELHNVNFMEPPLPVLKDQEEVVGEYVPIVQIDPLTTEGFSISPYASSNFEPSLPKLETLVLFGSRMNLLDQTRLLHHCDQLQSLSWSILNFTNLVNNLGADMHFRFQKLTHLDLFWTQLSDADIADLLARTPQVTHLNLNKTLIGRHTIERIVGPGMLEDADDEVGQALAGAGPVVFVSHAVGDHGLHGLRNKLVSLDIIDCLLVTSHQVRSILWHCSELKDLRATVVAARDLFDPPLNANDAAPAAGALEIRDWACTKLEMLHINIVDVPALTKIEDQQRAIMAQIGRLHHLRALSIESTTLNREVGTRTNKTSLHFSLQAGLDELATLSRLRSFHFGSVKHLMGAAEYEWMGRHWSGLRELGGNLMPQATYEDEKLAMKEFVEQLLPKVRFVRRSESRFWGRGRKEEDEDEEDAEDGNSGVSR